MQLDKTNFGSFEGQDIDLYALTNNNGMTVKVMNYGATITDIILPDGTSITCGFDTFESYFTEEYKNNAPFFGSTVGRYCGQIKDSKFELNGKTFELAKIAGNNNLHGGLKGFDKKVWNAATFEKDDCVGVDFTVKSADLEEGFPGNVDVKVNIKLTNDNEIVINYEATPDADTPLTMTNHTYFNLSGFKSTVEGFEVKLNTTKLMEMDDTGAATGVVKDVSGTIDDLSAGKVIKECHDVHGGFEHFYVFDKLNELKETAVIKDPVSGRSLQIQSTEPCMLFYTGKYTSDELKRNDANKYGQFRGFCCETQRYQNGPNIPESPGTITKAGDTYTSTTKFKLTF